MQFNLPSNLKDAIVAYDPSRKSIRQARKEGSGKPKNKSKYPLGNPHDLIPADIVPPEQLANAIQLINDSPAADRHHSFRRLKFNRECDMNPEDYTYAIIFHFESLWVAAWLPPEKDKDSYVFGYARAFKNLNRSISMIPNHVLNYVRNNGKIVNYGRSEFYVDRQLVTTDLIKQKASNGRWSRYVAPWDNLYGGYSKKRNIQDKIKKFEHTLASSIPNWGEREDWYSRIVCRNVFDALDIGSNDEFWTESNIDRDTAKINLELIIKISQYCTGKGGYLSDNFNNIYCTKDIISTPVIKKWINKRLDDINEKFENIEFKDKRYLMNTWSEVKKLLSNIVYINGIWPKCPLDYYQRHIELLSKLHLYLYKDYRIDAKEWLAENMPVSSFFNIISRVENPDQNTEWNDTISMLSRILSHKDRDTVLPLKTPKRWRITEFHDYIQGESWKLDNERIGMPQDLFPTPINVETATGEKWSFFQPIDTHQLAQWGRAVRNCVGNASFYAEGVKKKKHFIVLGMVNHKPTFTIQLKVDDGVMTVVQVVSVANRRLTPEETAEYGEVFKTALLQREAQLNSAQSND